MSRFFVSPDAVRGSEVVVSGAEAHHIIDVMRLTVSDRVVVFDGTGTEYEGVIREIRPRAVTIAIERTREPVPEAGPAITLVQALPKKEKMDYIVEKATELGVARIIPVVTERTIPRWSAEKAGSRRDRWELIAREAAKQCGRTALPAIHPIAGLDEALRATAAARPRMIAALCDDARPFKESLAGTPGGEAAIAIGPEGDFTPAELAAARQAGYAPVTLGPRVLKSDTAGLAALAIMHYAYER